MRQRGRFIGLLAGMGMLAAAAWQPASADLSAFVGYVGFGDVKDAKMGGSPGVGLRWGESSGFIGGETSLMIARPERKVDLSGSGVGEASDILRRLNVSSGVGDTSGAKGTGTAIFYEARLTVNIPLGKIRPFVDVGFGQIIVTSTEAVRDTLPTSIAGLSLPDNQKIAAANKTLKALNAVSKLQRNTAFSYGVGGRYALNSRLDLRVDLRQYVVISVTGLIAEKAAQQIGQVGGPEFDPEKKKATLYHEMSAGVSFKF